MRGSIHKRTLQDGSPRYDARWRDQRGRSQVKTFTRKKDAADHLDKVVPQVKDGSFQKAEPKPMGEVFDLWLSDEIERRVLEGDLKDSTASTYRSNVKVHLKPELGDVRSDHLSARVMKDWRKRMARKIADDDMAPKSFNNLLNLLAQILKWARQPAQAYLSHDPLVGQERLKVDRPEADYLEDEDMSRLLGAVAGDPEASAIVHVALLAGLRRGEIFALQWADVEERDVGGRIHVRRSVYQSKVRKPKTDNSARTVDVPQRVLDALAAHREETPPMEDDYIFRTRTGQPADPNTWYRRNWPGIRKRAKLPKGVGLHSLRHTYASMLIRNGENPKYTSRQLGHSSTSFTMDTYGHLFEATSTEAMERLESMAPKAKKPKLRVVGGSVA